MTSIAGVRSNQLVGYGVVVGLRNGDGHLASHCSHSSHWGGQFGLVTDAANLMRRMSPR